MRPLIPAVIVLAVALAAGCTAPAADTDAPATPAARPTGGASEGDAGGPSAPPPVTPSTPAVPGTMPGLPRFGVAYSPADATAPSSFFVQAADVGDLVMWGGDVDELADATGAADVIATLARQHGLAFGAQIGFHHPGEAFDDAAQASAMANVISFVQRQTPTFVALGVELDRIAASDPAWLDEYAVWYDKAYDAVKATSPGTLVFPTFQLEHTKGLTGGLFGGPDLSPARWDVVERFPERDLTAFTTYPSLLYASPGGIPDDYYTSLRERYVGPIGFTETGWHAGDTIQGWESSEAEQAAFVTRFLADAEEMEASLTMWTHLHDQPSVSPEPFQTMGLIGTDGMARDAYDAWAAGIYN